MCTGCAIVSFLWKLFSDVIKSASSAAILVSMEMSQIWPRNKGKLTVKMLLLQRNRTSCRMRRRISCTLIFKGGGETSRKMRG